MDTRADLSCEEEKIVNAGGEINSFYDVYEPETEEMYRSNCRLIGMPLDEDFEEFFEEFFNW